MKKPTYSDIANDWNLWVEYVDPIGVGTEEEFNSISVEDRLKFIEKCFGPETISLDFHF